MDTTTLTRAQIAYYKSLRTPEGRRQEGRYLLEGEKTIEEAVGAGYPVKEILISARLQKQRPELCVRLLATGTAVLVDDEQMGRLSALKTPPGVLMVSPLPTVGLADLLEGQAIVALFGINDPGNLGTILRTADWFGIASVIATEDTVDYYNEKVIRGAMGAHMRLNLYRSADMEADLKKIKEKGYRFVCTTARSQKRKSPLSGRLCVGMGSEAHGIPARYEALADDFYSIPGSGRSESLNVAVSFGIAAYELAWKTNVA